MGQVKCLIQIFGGTYFSGPHQILSEPDWEGTKVWCGKGSMWDDGCVYECAEPGWLVWVQPAVTGFGVSGSQVLFEKDPWSRIKVIYLRTADPGLWFQGGRRAQRLDRRGAERVSSETGIGKGRESNWRVMHNQSGLSYFEMNLNCLFCELIQLASEQTHRRDKVINFIQHFLFFLNDCFKRTFCTWQTSHLQSLCE